MKRLLLAGGGQAHVLVLREIARHQAAGDLHDVEVVVVTPSNQLRYSGMLPGWIAGHYALHELTVDLTPLIQAAGARWVAARVQRLNLADKIALTDQGEAIHFDMMSIATGAVIDIDSIPGAREHALPLRPFEDFVTGWQRLIHQAETAREPFRLAVIGGGAGGAETALAAAYRASTMRPPMRVQLITGGLPILPGHSDAARRLISAALQRRDVQVIDAAAQRVEPGAVIVDGNRKVDADAALIITGASAARWLRDSSLALDENGFAAVNSHLQSTSHPCVFATGDTASVIEAPRPKSGVYAVRAAPVLAHNLVAALGKQPLSVFSPQRRALYLVTTGPRHAVASWGRWAFAGRWVWRWKNWIDRDYIATLRHPPTSSR